MSTGLRTPEQATGALNTLYALVKGVAALDRVERTVVADRAVAARAGSEAGGGPAVGRRIGRRNDVSDPADLRGLWPPTSPYGHSLATTRRREAALAGHGHHVIGVGLFTEAEAVAHLTSSLAAHDRHEPTDQLAALASDLGHLPLALSQATAYPVDAGLECSAYRSLLAGRAKKLTQLMPETGALPDDQDVALSAARSLSVERADRLHPVGLARPMLQLAAMLDSVA
ncbi:hypothetical protein PV367_17925 [Streptomyces europaeiscabiei]|uniref:Uncharacterized protein n=1 Tax=Streptomyces europaeiscabiei TaxID=146819 RepID=A0AAJ2UMG7_9ACTN|nr:hypothetical protein [Streptomyces europaeiscabiei]MDX3131621.1 hypothetical protein [Streptomyces europaeiscabiei]